MTDDGDGGAVELVGVEVIHLGRGVHDERRLTAGDRDPDTGGLRARDLTLLPVRGSGR